MKTVLKSAACLLLALGFVASQAKASLIYGNGPINGNLDAWFITSGYSVSNSFTSSGSFNLDSAQVGLWADPGNTPATIDWSIGTSPFANDIASGTSSFTNMFLFTNPYGVNIYQSTFSITGMIGAGTYYLTLGNGTSALNFAFGWDENNGASTAYDNSGSFQIPSESFQIFGTNGTGVPDAGSTVMLLGMGLAGMGWLRRKVLS